MPTIDLHSHSRCSDGSLAPAELVALAREIELDGWVLMTARRG